MSCINNAHIWQSTEKLNLKISAYDYVIIATIIASKCNDLTVTAFRIPVILKV